MSEKIEKFCDNLRVRLTDVDDRIANLKAGLDAATARTKADIDFQLNKAKSDLEAHKREAEQVQERVNTLLEEKKTQTEASIGEWVRDRKVEKMEARAQLTEDYAAEQVWLATVAVEEAELATLEALAARIEADDLAAR